VFCIYFFIQLERSGNHKNTKK